jgi:RNA polymerase sigma-70 factor (ECF subfamily)
MSRYFPIDDSFVVGAGLVLTLTERVGETMRMTQARASMALDDATFGPMTEPLRRDLLLHCYRFSGSLTEAEDLVQDTLARAWRARAGYLGDAGLRTWLRRIATRVCLDALRSRRRTLPSALDPAGSNGHEILWLDPLPAHLLADAAAAPAAAYDLRESVSLAFLAALQRLPARQRAVLLLRDVFAMRAAEVADELEISESAVTSLLHRARRTMKANDAQPGFARPPDAATASLLRAYVDAWQSGDVNAVVALLKRDAVVEMPPVALAPTGHAAIRAFFAGGILDGTPDRWIGVPISANGGPAAAMYERTTAGDRFIGVHVLALDGDAIRVVTAFMDPDLAERFEVPATLPR